MFETLLIAGQGEDIRRIERTCKRIGIDLAASGEPETDAPQGEVTDVDDLLATAVRAGATAVFPVGFTPSDALRLARSTRDAGLVFVGPSTSSLELLADPAALSQAAQRSGSARLDDPGKAARHLDVTVVIDAKQTGLVLVEREVSLRNDDVLLLAESPSALFSLRQEGEADREHLAAAALGLAKAIELEGVATFRFVGDPHGRLHFLNAVPGFGEATLALELTTQTDPFELQLEVAAGRPLRPEASLRTAGHAFEACLRGQPHPDADELQGPLTELAFPPVPHARARIEPSINLGDAPQPTPSGLARIASMAPIRHQAFLGLDRILAETRVAPTPTNLPLLRDALNHDSFRAGQYDADFCRRVLLGTL